MRATLFLAAVTILLVALGSTAIFFWLRARKASASSWEGLLGRLARVNQDNIKLIALDLLEEGAGGLDVSLEPGSIWEMIGGLDGLEALEANCGVLIELACYVQRLYPEAVVVAEQLRLNAREINWHVERLKGASQRGNLSSSFPDYAQRAITTYYLMTRDLLALYREGSLPELIALQQAIHA